MKEKKCILCGEIDTPYGGLMKIADDVVHMECALRWTREKSGLRYIRKPMKQWSSYNDDE